MSEKRDRPSGPPPQGRRSSMAPTQRRPSEAPLGRPSDSQRSLGRRRHERDQPPSAPRRDTSPSAPDIPRPRRMTLSQFVDGTTERRSTLTPDDPRLPRRRSEVMRPSPAEPTQLQTSRSGTNRRPTPDANIRDKKPVDRKITEGKPLDNRPSEERSPENKPSEVKASDTRPTITKPLEEKSSDTRPQEKKPSEVRPPITRPLEEKSPDTKPQEKTSSEVKRPEKRPSETSPKEMVPPDNRSSDTRPDTTKAPEKGSSGVKTSDKSTAETKPAEARSSDTRSEDLRLPHKGRRSSQSKSPESKPPDPAPADAKPTGAMTQEPNTTGSQAQTLQRSDLPSINESSSDASAYVARERQVSIAPNPPEPSSASSAPTSPEEPSEFVLNTPMKPAALTTQPAEESPATQRPSTLPRAPKRRRSEDIAVVIPPPVPEFRRPSDDSGHKSFPRRTSLLSRHARRASGGPSAAPTQPEAKEQPSERRSSLSDRLRTLKHTASPPARDQMAVRPLIYEDDERRRRSSSIVESHYGLDQPLSSGHAVFTGVVVTALLVAYGFKLDLPNALDRMTDHDVPLDLNTRRAVMYMERWGICPDSGSSMYSKDGPFKWNAATHRMLMRAFHLGYMFSGIPGAVLAEKTSAKWVLVAGGCCLLLSALLFPVISLFDARFSAEVFIFLLLFHGAGAGVMLPAITTLLSKWTTRRHRSAYAGIVYGGMWLGPVFSNLVDAITSNTRWQFTYHYMVLGIIPWVLIVSFWLEDDTSHRDRCVPLRDHMIVVAEQANVRSYDITICFPFTEIAKSVHFWALLLIHFSGNLAFLTVNYLMPFYMRQILRHNVNESLVMAVVPYLAMFFVSMTAGLAIDVARHHGVLSTTSGRRFSALIAVLVPAVAIACVTFIECNTSIASATYLVALCGLGAQTVGWFANHLDLTPNFAGPLMAITNTVATIPYVFWPTLTALTTEGFPEDLLRERWGMIFQGVAGIYLISFIFYIIGGTAVLQSWNAGRKVT